MKPTLSAVMVGALTALVATLGLLPVHAAAAPAPGDAPGISRIVLTDAGGHRTAAALAGGPERAAAAVRTGALSVDEFLVAGLTWAAGEQLPAGADIKMRVREDGGWSGWLEVEPEAASDDPAAPGGTEPFITGGADGVQVVVMGSPADLPADLRLSLISAVDDGAPATSSSVTPASARAPAADGAATTLATTPSVTTPAGAVVPRAGWRLTATEENYTTQHWTPKYYPLQAAVVHHTAGTNTYSADQSAAVVHSIWQYHAVERVFGDIGYNFLVDKYGQVFEGRRHSLPQSGDYSVADEVPAGWSIAAAHATGYNNGGLGISAMGDYTRSPKVADPTNPLLLDAIAQLIAWKFNEANLDVVVGGARVPSGFVSPGTSSTYPVGAALPRIFVHKDVAATDCPGSIANTDIMEAIYGRVDALITQAADTTPPAVTLAADKGTVTLAATDDSGAPPAIFHTTDGAKVFYSPNWNVTACGAALGVTNPASCVGDTRYTAPFSLSVSSSVSFLAVDATGNTTAEQATLVPVNGTVVPNNRPSVIITNPVNDAKFGSGDPITFAGSATDAESGDITADLVWTYDGVGEIGTGGTVTTSLSAGTHTITATATDSGGMTGSAGITVTVGEPAPAEGIALSVRAYKIKATKYAELTWSGGTSAFTINRNGVAQSTTVSGSTYTDAPPKTSVSATYKVCETGTTVCSNDVTVAW